MNIFFCKNTGKCLSYRDYLEPDGDNALLITLSDLNKYVDLNGAYRFGILMLSEEELLEITDS